MAKMGKRAQSVKAELEYERKQQAREEYIASLSPEEREEFFHKEKRSRDNAHKLLSTLSSIGCFNQYK